MAGDRGAPGWRAMGLRGAVRGKAVRTTIPDKALPCPLDRVRRELPAPAPDRLWVSDFDPRRDVAGLRPCRARHRPRTDGGRGSLIDAHARRSAGRAGEPQRHGGLRDGRARTGDPPAVHRRRPADTGLVAHSDRGSQHLATRHAERLAEAGIEPSVGSVGDSCDNALAETVIGLFKTEAIRRRGPWRSLEATEPRHARTEAPRETANGSIGSTTVACSGPSVMSRPPRPRPATTNSRRLPRWRRSLPNEITSEEPEAVQVQGAPRHDPGARASRDSRRTTRTSSPTPAAFR